MGCVIPELACWCVRNCRKWPTRATSEVLEGQYAASPALWCPSSGRFVVCICDCATSRGDWGAALKLRAGIPWCCLASKHAAHRDRSDSALYGVASPMLATSAMLRLLKAQSDSPPGQLAWAAHSNVHACRLHSTTCYLRLGKPAPAPQCFRPAQMRRHQMQMPALAAACSGLPVRTVALPACAGMRTGRTFL